MEFTPFPKLARLSREMIVTEKLDGTNAQVHITQVPDEALPTPGSIGVAHEGVCYDVRAGSRNRWITPEADNYGFASWVWRNACELVKLGPGAHFGEWWGKGIQRGYGLDEKRFSLFNTGRWESGLDLRCHAVPVCHVVPVLHTGVFCTATVDDLLADLHQHGSKAVEGFMNPEGVVVYHAASKQLFKKTLDKNDKHKGTHSAVAVTSDSVSSWSRSWFESDT